MVISQTGARHSASAPSASPPRTAGASSRWRRCLLGVIAVGASLATSASAEAYVVRETASGLPVRWPSDDVSLEVDPSLTAAVPDALAAATAAAAGWTDTGAGPELHVSLAASASVPAVDGRNVIYFIPGYPAAAGALAITIVSYDDVTGAIVDTDVVINGSYGFAVLPATARAPVGATQVANEPALGGADGPAWPFGAAAGIELAPPTFDLIHVLAHETGHVLGLRDATDEVSDVMYLWSSPDDAARRTPASDDAAGVMSLYAGMSSGQGCASAATAGAPSSGVLSACVLGLVAVGAVRRRHRVGARGA